MMDKLVVLARGLGTRMRAADDAAAMGEQQRKAAAEGAKGMMPVAGGRPFLDYVLDAAARGGMRRVCLVIGPEHEAVRRYYGGLEMRKISVTFAVQDRSSAVKLSTLVAQIWNCVPSFDFTL